MPTCTERATRILRLIAGSGYSVNHPLRLRLEVALADERAHIPQVAAVPESGGGLAHTSGSSLGEDGGPDNHTPTETGAGGG